MRWKWVPVARPASASAAWLAEVRTTGMPAAAAMRAASTLVTMPPVPTPALPALPIWTCAMSSGPRTSSMREVPGLAGVAVVEAVDVGEQDEQVGADEVGDEGGEPVVVAEADLVGGDGVVLVDDGERAHGEELVEGAVGVAVVGAAAGVVGGEQDLSDAYAVAGEGGGVAGDEEALADAGGGLLAGEVLGAAAQSERGEAGGDGAGGDEDDLLLAAAACLGEDVDEGVDPVRVEAAGGGGE